MKLRDIEIYLIRQQADFFQFAMCLTADEDLSEKIIMDSEFLLLSEQREEISHQLCSAQDNAGAFLRYCRRFIFSSLFRIARKNNLYQKPYAQRTEESAYWLLPMEQRAVLCLRHKLKLSKDEITEILSLTATEYFNLLNLARESILKTAGSREHDLRETF
ncbi:MAG: DNA-directed RNA polymerase specialized sigma24 family protein [Bacteriovoracaceae bacterium]|jgi:DNA-directed RNA polymerase specialized sigma24 family protein